MKYFELYLKEELKLRVEINKVENESEIFQLSTCKDDCDIQQITRKFEIKPLNSEKLNRHACLGSC